MAFSLLLWNARSLPRKTQEFKNYLGITKPTVVGLCETWLSPHIYLNLPGYIVTWKDRCQGHSGGLLLAIQDTFTYSPIDLPQWPHGHLEVVAARVSSTKGWITVAACYNTQGTASYQEFTHYFSHLPPPVILMGDFNAHHRCWEPNLPLHHTNTSGKALFQVILDSPHLSLFSPPGLPTRYHPHTGGSLRSVSGRCCLHFCHHLYRTMHRQ